MRLGLLGSYKQMIPSCTRDPGWSALRMSSILKARAVHRVALATGQGSAEVHHSPGLQSFGTGGAMPHICEAHLKHIPHNSAPRSPQLRGIAGSVDAPGAELHLAALCHFKPSWSLESLRPCFHTASTILVRGSEGLSPLPKELQHLSRCRILLGTHPHAPSTLRLPVFQSPLAECTVLQGLTSLAGQSGPNKRLGKWRAISWLPLWNSSSQSEPA